MRALLVMTVLLTVPVTLRADQAMWISKDLAEQASALIKEGDEVRGYCAPCGDKGYEKITVKSKAVKPVGEPSESYHALVLNGDEMDLAYTYVKKDDKWVNVALLLKAEVAMVDEILPPTVPELPAEGAPASPSSPGP